MNKSADDGGFRTDAGGRFGDMSVSVAVAVAVGVCGGEQGVRRNHFHRVSSVLPQLTAAKPWLRPDETIHPPVCECCHDNVANLFLR